MLSHNPKLFTIIDQVLNLEQSIVKLDNSLAVHYVLQTITNPTFRTSLILPLIQAFIVHKTIIEKSVERSFQEILQVNFISQPYGRQFLVIPELDNLVQDLHMDLQIAVIVESIKQATVVAETERNEL